ncbi:MAG: LytTR family DNA-binding domain-containing protein [Candidatus Enteromonas sp.]|nr:LytTR family DNA-binding domain-containing protein [Candidatus Enteromonas sp.]
MKLRIGLLEDDAREAEITLRMLERFFREEGIEYSIDRAEDAESFFALPLDKYDLLFLDILLGGDVTGMDVAKRIRAKNNDVSIVFLTKSTHFAIDGYQVGAIDYIVKPLVYDELFLKLRKVLDYVRHATDRDVILKALEGTVVVKESDVYYIEVIKHYLYFHTRLGEIVVRSSMKEVADMLGAKFARSGNSFLIHLGHVCRVGKNGVFVDAGTKIEEVPLTSGYRESFMLALRDFCGA